MKSDLTVCTIGGGSGMPIVNRALVKCGFKNIKSIVTTFDSGGDTGRMRTDERGKLLAFSDYWRSLISLWDDGKQKDEWESVLGFRDGRGRNFGNIFFQFLSEMSGDLSKVDSLFSKLTRTELCGSVIPVALSPTDVCFETKSGKIYRGEHHLDELRMSKDVVKKMWLSEKIRANSEAVESIRNADVIIVCPGSMYGSVLINFLPEGMSESYVKSKAKKILMTNIMSVSNENNCFCQDDYVDIFSKYIGMNEPFDLVIMADLSELEKNILNKVLKYYELENSFPIKWKKKSKVRTILGDVVAVDEINFRLRHSEDKMAELFKKIEI